jgi:hypothetical protein
MGCTPFYVASDTLGAQVLMETVLIGLPCSFEAHRKIANENMN